ncbi:MAG: hypothetical protein ABIQ86_16640 [Steroidobacteraceae bacterium]
MHSKSTSLYLPVLLGALSTVFAAGIGSAAESVNHDHTHAAAPQSEKTDPVATMQQMQSMHAKMMAAKTPAERQALMAEHMATMHKGMMAMQQMGASSAQSPMDPQMMQKRMDMMTMMMQMMMDHHEMGGMGMGGMQKGTPPESRANDSKK